MEISGHTVIPSGRKNSHHAKGVALVISDKVAKALLEWKPLGERLILARFNPKYAKLTVITCSALTEDVEEAIKDAFYDQLQEVIQEVQSHEVLCVTGYFNARVGNDNEGCARSRGRTGVLTSTTMATDYATRASQIDH